jgi:hypothetical protein
VARILIITVAQEEELWLYAPEGRSSGNSEHPFTIAGVWVEANPPGLTENMSPVVVELKLEPHPSAKNSTSFPTGPRPESKTLDRLLKYRIL